ncbi:MAG: class I SAM-dependent methyltransferase [Balneolales bacterium]|nr:class I SAM-dependent methyltransferase [Balneolales bacterium]
MLSTAEHKKKPWPTKAVMEQVYEKNLWGGKKGDFYSGFGSHNQELVVPYIEAVSSFLKSFDKPTTVCDLGCGDFNIGKELAKCSGKYFAIDIAENLINRNKEMFRIDNVEFLCLDISRGGLPGADVAILRHVLQHVSNDEVHRVLNELAKFKYVIITEHIPEGEFIPNKDIISGQGTRLNKKSGLNLLTFPFNFVVEEYSELLKIKDDHGIIVTTLYKLPK